ncbi:hypothetical protein OC844_004119 [Tilletia horrida]|nr:hypothetical protein OC844_004119 [Tilletia horrida]
MLEPEETYTRTAQALAQQPQTLTAFLRWAASRHPSATALQQGHSPGRLLSYSELVHAASTLAVRLRKEGVQQGAIVPILTGRKTAELLIIQYAIMLAGAAFAPMDPSFPVGVTGHKISKCRAATIIVQDVDASKISELEQNGALRGAKIVRLDGKDASRRDAEANGHADGAADMDDAKPDAVAYVMFTSGSTGNPKGVLQTHEQACAAMRAFIPQFYFGPTSRVLSTISAAWDISCCDTFATLSSGGILCLSEAQDILTAYGDDLDTYKITSTNVPPALVSTIKNPDTISRLDILISGGDKAETEQFAKWAKLGPKVFNGYGLTETGIGNLAFDAAASKLDPKTRVVPLGKPYGENEVFIMKADSLEEVTQGEEGEVVLGGPQIASAYLDEESLTAQRFVRSADGSKRLFRTGDLGRIRPDGHVELSGRADDVIKLVGYRVGPEEVQAPLREVLGDGSFCCASTVEVKDGSHDAKLILAFVPPGGDGTQEARKTQDAAELLFSDDEAKAHRHQWQARLVAKAEETISYYARPAAYLPIRFIPLNSNHKHDRKRVAEAVRYAAEQKHLVFTS